MRHALTYRAARRAMSGDHADRRLTRRARWSTAMTSTKATPIIPNHQRQSLWTQKLVWLPHIGVKQMAKQMARALWRAVHVA